MILWCTCIYLKGNLHVTVCQSDFAKKTYSKHKNRPNLPFGRIPLRRKDSLININCELDAAKDFRE